jgi:hypothetical protein
MFFRPGPDESSELIADALPLDVLFVGDASDLTSAPTSPMFVDRNTFERVMNAFVGDRQKSPNQSCFWNNVRKFQNRLRIVNKQAKWTKASNSSG